MAWVQTGLLVVLLVWIVVRMIQHVNVLFILWAKGRWPYLTCPHYILAASSQGRKDLWPIFACLAWIFTLLLVTYWASQGVWW